MNGRVLIVHAAVVMRMMVRANLSEAGYEVVGQAQNGAQALALFSALMPDVVTIDMVLPDLDAIAVIRTIVAQFPQARIIICTSLSEPALLAQALEAGAKAFITKPFGPVKLAAVIAKVFAPANAA